MKNELHPERSIDMNNDINNDTESFEPAVKTEQRVLQKISKVVAIISLITAIASGIYLVFFVGENPVMKASMGALTFFCFMVALVLNTIAETNLPNLSVPTSKSSNDLHKQHKNTNNS